MRAKPNAKIVITMGIALGLLLTDCNAKLEKKIDKLSAKVEKIEKKVATLSAKIPPARRRPQIDYNKVYPIPLEGSPAKGASNPVMTIVEFSDFQCPFCAKAVPAISEFYNKHKDEVKIVFKHFPLSFHRNARPAAIAALAAHRQGKFWEMHDALFQNSRALSPALYEQTAQKLGLNLDQFKKDIADPELAKAIDSDIAAGRAAGVTGTPSIYINGRRAQSRSAAYFESELKKLKNQASN